MKKSQHPPSFPLSLDELQSHWKAFNAVYFQNALSAIDIQWSARLTSSAGMFVNRHGPRSRRLDQNEQQHTVRLIRLSLPLLTGKPLVEIRRTLAHEMIHQWQYDVKKRHPSHGADFRQMMAIMNEDGLGITVYHSFTNDVEALAKYAWQCMKCGQAYRRQRRTLSPRRHRCGYCQGSLREIQPGLHTPWGQDHRSDKVAQVPFLEHHEHETHRSVEIPQQLVFAFMRN
ncbi:MAG: hypothetical protein GKS05_10775 [Nitrospirales bacterium]|nr:hypothetical protein [Nitrospirales bacterium]